MPRIIITNMNIYLRSAFKFIIELYLLKKKKMLLLCFKTNNSQIFSEACLQKFIKMYANCSTE